MKDAELSWLDARIARRKAVADSVTTTTAMGQMRLDGETSTSRAIAEHDEEDDDDRERPTTTRMETEENAGGDEQEEEARLSNTEAVSADTFCLEQLPLNMIPSHQVR